MLGGAVFGVDADGVEALVVLGQAGQRQAGHAAGHRHIHQGAGLQKFIWKRGEELRAATWVNRRGRLAYS